MVDGLGVGDVGNIVLRDRQHSSEDGIGRCTDSKRERTSFWPDLDIVSRGFVFMHAN